MSSVTGTFGNMLDKKCVVCGNEIHDVRVLKMTLTHRDSGRVLSRLWYHPPLCQEHRKGTPLDVQMGWDGVEPI